MSFGNCLNDEYRVLQQKMGFSAPELAQLAKNGFEVADLNVSSRRESIQEIDQLLGVGKENPMQDRFTCPEGVSGRADKVLADYYQDFSRAFIKQSIEQREITYADGSVLVPKSKINPGDVLLVSLVRPKIEELIPYNYNLSVLYEDEHLLVIDKEPGMVVHPGDGTDGKTLVHALLHHCGSNLSPIGAPLYPGIVHRLDKETSGVMVVAKSELAHLSLLDQFASRKTAKIYLGLSFAGN